MEKIILAVILILISVLVIKLTTNLIRKDRIKKQEQADKEYARSIYESYRQHHKEEMINDINALKSMYESNEREHNLELMTEADYQANLQAIAESIKKVEQKYGID